MSNCEIYLAKISCASARIMHDDSIFITLHMDRNHPYFIVEHVCFVAEDKNEAERFLGIIGVDSFGAISDTVVRIAGLDDEGGFKLIGHIYENKWFDLDKDGNA